MKVETGVMVMKDGKAWGAVYEDGRSTVYGWIEPERAPIHDPKFCKHPTSVTWQNSPYIKELKGATVVHVTRKTTVEFAARPSPPREKQ